MSAKLIDGLAAAAVWQDETRAAIERRDATRAPVLRVLLVGDHPASRAYVKRKARVSQEVGIDAALIELAGDIPQAELISVIRALNADQGVDGILVQLPLPDHIDEDAVILAIDPAKDVDGFHPVNVGRLHINAKDPAALLPCTPMGSMRLIASAIGGDDLSGKSACVIGRSNIVGKPMAALLLAANATVFQVHSRTPQPEAIARQADILIAAVGRARMIGPAWVKPGATIIDVGINRIQKGEKSVLVGDVDYEAVLDSAGAITPVPGGVGPMTVAGLMANTLKAADNQR